MLLALLTLTPPSDGLLHGQTLGVFTGKTTAQHPELGDPSEFGVSLTLDIASRFLVRTAYTKFASSSHRTDRVCTWYEPPHDCAVEAVDGKSDLAGVSVAALPYIRVADWMRLAGGGGISLNRIRADIQGDSGRPAWFHLPRTGMWGGIALASVRVGPFHRIPLFVAANATSHWVRMDGCLTEVEKYDPFCGTQRFQALEVEVGYGFSFMR